MNDRDVRDQDKQENTGSFEQNGNTYIRFNSVEGIKKLKELGYMQYDSNYDYSLSISTTD